MPLDVDALTISTEADVEQQLLYPVLTEDRYLRIAADRIRTKEYLAPSEIDKKAGKAKGYYPDYSIWQDGFAVVIVEAKSPDVSAETGYREASLYARHLNQAYPSGINPTKFLIACNGVKFLCGYHDAEPELDFEVEELKPGSAALKAVVEFCGRDVLIAHGADMVAALAPKQSVRPFNLAGGGAILNAQKPLNTFAPELSPVLRRYFSSASLEDTREIATRAYVSSAEVTEYDRVLEALLKDRMINNGGLVKQVETTRNNEPLVTGAITAFQKESPERGQIQIIQGGVGVGKSLFIRRYKEVLQSPALKEKTYWAFIDFNAGLPNLDNAEKWVCETFLDSFANENPNLDITSSESLRRIFSRNLMKRRGIYEEISKTSTDQANLTRAADLGKWQEDPIEFADGLANYILKTRGETLIVVMDNVDRLDLSSQLKTFQLALWFMEKTRCFVILQMRDETYERFKDKKPLDTFRTGIAFHISPPRFIDIVKRRLELSIEYLNKYAKEKQTYTLESGARISFPKSDLGTFLRGLYIELFERKRNISRILEALAGRDVRRALEMFVSIITSGHLSESAITSLVKGGGTISISEYVIIRILMRTRYRYFSEQSGLITNIFNYKNEWNRPDNFILIEILFLLARDRKRQGQLGLEGYFSCRSIADTLQLQGYDPNDSLGALKYLLERQLISADHQNFTNVEWDDCVKIQASGFMHIRVLSERTEYLAGVIPTTPIVENSVATRLADFVNLENSRGQLSIRDKVRLVEVFEKYLKHQKSILKDRLTLVDPESTGAAYILERIAASLKQFYNESARSEPNQLDL